MTFVHGHPRDTGWVKSHFRRPRRAGHEQLDLDGGTVPSPRGPLEDGFGDGEAPDDPDDPDTPDDPDDG
jgi:hypothetical protein